MVLDKIKEIVSEQLGTNSEDITMNTNFKNDLEADSLDLFQIINDIEDEFDIKIENAESINTIADAVKFVEEHVK